jgi:Tat protein secretion system quality control protein TatD with DNase activity
VLFNNDFVAADARRLIAHIAGEDFDVDRDAVRERAEVAGVHAVLVVGEDPDDNARVLRVIAEGDESGCEVMTKLLPCLGFHPDRFADDCPLPTVVRSEQKQKLVRRLPLEPLALESDSPVLGPERDRRNEPANLTFARDFIAEAHGVSPDRVDEVTTTNAKRLFPLLTSCRG